MNSRLQRIAGSPLRETLIDRLSRINIAELATGRTFYSGERDFARGWVASCKVENGGKRIAAMARNKSWKLYSVTIDVAEVTRSVVDIEGKCSCSVQFNCKHVVATLFQAIADNQAARRVSPAKPESALAKSQPPKSAPAKSARASETREVLPAPKPAPAP